MNTPAIETIIKMMETLPEDTQNRVLEHLQDYLADLADEEALDIRFKGTQNQLASAAKRAHEQINQGQAKWLDLNDL